MCRRRTRPPVRGQAITLTSADFLSIEPLEIIFGETKLKYENRKMHFKMSSAKWRTLCCCLYVLRVVGRETRRLLWLSIRHSHRTSLLRISYPQTPLIDDEQNGRNFADDILKGTILIQIIVSIPMLLSIVSSGPINNGPSHYLNQFWPSLLTQKCVTWPWSINIKEFM